MKSRYTSLALLVAALSLGSCKGTEDYLQDLQTVYDRDQKQLRADVYDAGQLVHEAFAGLADVDTLTLSQAARAVALAAYVVAMEKETVPLCQAQGVTLLAHLAERYPIPPVTAPYEFTETAKVREVAKQQIDILHKLEDQLSVEATYLPGLSSADKAIVQRSVEALQSATGEQIGPDPKAWQAWWDANGQRVRAQAAEQAGAPFRDLGACRFTDGRALKPMLLYLGIFIGLFDLKEIRDLQTEAVLRLSRQVIAFGIQDALRNGVPEVRGAAALAAARVIDPGFADPLVYALSRERETLARSRIIQTMGRYPRRDVILALIGQLEDDDHTILENTHRSLVAITAEDFGTDLGAWQLWWDKTGKHRWP